MKFRLVLFVLRQDMVWAVLFLLSMLALLSLPHVINERQADLAQASWHARRGMK